MHYSGTDANEGGDITRLIRKELQSMVSKKDDWVCLTEDNVDTIYDAFQIHLSLMHLRFRRF